MKHEKITEKFIKMVESDSELKRLLEKNLEIGRKINPDKAYNPAQSLEKLYDFLDWSVKCMPWEVLKGVSYNSLYSRLDQTTGYFWYIFDQPLEELKGRGYYYPTLHYHEPIASFVKDYSKAWGKFLSKRKSWNEEYYNLFKCDKKFGLQEGWYGDKNIWKTFNDFFSRKLADPKFRPIGNADIISPADSLPKGCFKIGDDNRTINTLELKSANLNSVEDLIGKDSKYCKAFAGGTLTHTFLDIYDYHRYHFPVSGKILELRKIDGANAGGGITEWDEEGKRYVYYNEMGFQMIETRDCVILDTEFGLVAVLPVGMSQICSCNWEKGLKVGKSVNKGDPMGFFQFGGSDIVMIFQKGYKVVDLIPKDNEGNFKHILACENYANLERI